MIQDILHRGEDQVVGQQGHDGGEQPQSEPGEEECEHEEQRQNEGGLNFPWSWNCGSLQ